MSSIRLVHVFQEFIGPKFIVVKQATVKQCYNYFFFEPKLYVVKISASKILGYLL